MVERLIKSKKGILLFGYDVTEEMQEIFGYNVKTAYWHVGKSDEFDTMEEFAEKVETVRKYFQDKPLSATNEHGHFAHFFGGDVVIKFHDERVVVINFERGLMFGSSSDNLFDFDFGGKKNG